MCNRCLQCVHVHSIIVFISLQCDGLVKDYFPLMWTLLKSDVVSVVVVHIHV